ncbi:hypothetical protein DPMN_032171 [Dreissena polymorpha]|uniref:Uncharacterized protein n=1 Tax=Dreissena polymorpha TaxID=45954 RepID=A0A9D4M1C3_DREPO|nr:hypothetical protein DPMN_032171 [Dreissena polymorpha]
MAGLYLLVLLVLEHKEENIMALKADAHPLISGLIKCKKSKKCVVFICRKSEVIQA